MKCLAIIFVFMLTFIASAQAKNVDLSTVPGRSTVQLTIYNSEDLTLVRETRAVTFKKGANPLQFSWANTRIDPTSVELRFLKHADKLEVLDTTFPHDKPAMLYWNVQSEIDGEAVIEISYFTSGISWDANYTCIADRDEKLLHVDGFVRVVNNSGEDYEDAQVRLVVGTINLVQKMQALVTSNERGKNEAEVPARARQNMLREAMTENRAGRKGGKRDSGIAFGMGGAMADFEGDAKNEKAIEKESLGEYFIYTIEGTETIPNGWAKRMRSFEGADCPVKIQYRYRPEEYGDQLVRLYILTNDKASKLGTTPLPNGQVRVFRNNGRDGLSYLAAQTIKYVPIGDKIELNLGPDPEVIFELIKLKTTRDNLWMKVVGADVLQKIGGGARVDINSEVVGWDDRDLYTQRIRNYTPRAVEVEIRRAYNGHVIFRSELNTKLHDFRTVQFTETVPAGKRADLLHEIVTKQGRNSKQNNVEIERAKLQFPAVENKP